jgi:hypothetical protein
MRRPPTQRRQMQCPWGRSGIRIPAGARPPSCHPASFRPWAVCLPAVQARRAPPSANPASNRTSRIIVICAIRLMVRRCSQTPIQTNVGSTTSAASATTRGVRRPLLSSLLSSSRRTWRRGGTSEHLAQSLAPPSGLTATEG